MKAFLTLICILLVIDSTNAQFPADVYFSNQAEIDNFQDRYPNLTDIDGNVIICDGNTAEITNLNGLSLLTSIGGNLEISNNKALITLSGLHNLASIGGNLIIGITTTWSTFQDWIV
jgi:hypothetical protein